MLKYPWANSHVNVEFKKQCFMDLLHIHHQGQVDDPDDGYGEDL
jgi:hypothetical protein